MQRAPALRRLALASQWLRDDRLAPKLEAWCRREVPAAALPDSLLETLPIEPDEFWSWHCTFRSPRLRRAQPLLGAARMTDLAVNVLLPWLWMRAAEGGNARLQHALEQRYFSWPPAQDNSALRLARQRLLTARFDYLTLADGGRGVGGGFRYKTVAHITLKSIANNPELDPDKVEARREAIRDRNPGASDQEIERLLRPG